MSYGAPAAHAAASKGQPQAVAYAFYLALALAGLLVWRILALYVSGTELFFDEAQYWWWSRELDFGYYSKPPLIAWIIRASTELCGGSEFCIRLPSPIIHTATAVVAFFLARRLYDARTGFWAAVVFATLPGIAFSAGIISTDVPLLLFWALALLAFAALLNGGGWLAAAGLGVALGLGLLSKYAMVYFLMCAVVFAAWSGAWRRLLGDGRIYAALAIAAAIVAPNVLWNIENGFATVAHTADNANWRGSLFNPANALEFFASQAGVFGIILFIALLVIAWRARHGTTDKQKLLLSFSLPIILLITVQAFLSRAHANWAAAAYVAASVLVTAELLRANARLAFNGSLALHLALVGLIGAGNAMAGRVSLPGGIDPYERVLGWKAIADYADRKAIEGGFRAISTDRRALTAELLYYSSGRVPVYAHLDGDVPRDHFELTRPLTAETPGPILFVSFKDRAERLRASFRTVEQLEAKDIAAGPAATRRIYLFRVEGLLR